MPRLHSAVLHPAMGAVLHGPLARCRAACWQVAFIGVIGQAVSCLVLAMQAVRPARREVLAYRHTLASFWTIPDGRLRVAFGR